MIQFNVDVLFVSSRGVFFPFILSFNQKKKITKNICELDLYVFI